MWKPGFMLPFCRHVMVVGARQPEERSGSAAAIFRAFTRTPVVWG